MLATSFELNDIHQSRLHLPHDFEPHHVHNHPTHPEQYQRQRHPQDFYSSCSSTSKDSQGTSTPQNQQLIGALMSKITPSIRNIQTIPSLKIPSVNSCFEPVKSSSFHASQRPATNYEDHHISPSEQKGANEPCFRFTRPGNNGLYTFAPAKSVDDFEKDREIANSKQGKKAETGANARNRLRVAKDIMKLEWGTTSCHQCHTKKCPEKVLHCTNRNTSRNSSTSSPTSSSMVAVDESCRKRYCLGCLERKYGLTLDRIEDKEKWICPFCRDLCNCPPCSKKRKMRDLPSPSYEETNENNHLESPTSVCSKRSAEGDLENSLPYKRSRYSQDFDETDEDEALQVLGHLKSDSKENRSENLGLDHINSDRGRKEINEYSKIVNELNRELLEIFRRLEKSRLALPFLKGAESSRQRANIDTIDFSIIRRKLESHWYASYIDFYNDFALMVENSHKTCDVILPQIPMQGDQLLQLCTNELIENKDLLMELEEKIRNRTILA